MHRKSTDLIKQEQVSCARFLEASKIVAAEKIVFSLHNTNAFQVEWLFKAAIFCRPIYRCSQPAAQAVERNASEQVSKSTIWRGKIRDFVGAFFVTVGVSNRMC
jgi:hypothetical protein